MMTSSLKHVQALLLIISQKRSRLTEMNAIHTMATLTVVQSLLVSDP